MRYTIFLIKHTNEVFMPRRMLPSQTTYVLKLKESTFMGLG